MRDKKKRTLYFVCAALLAALELLCALLVWRMTGDAGAYDPDIRRVRAFLREEKYVIHAGGGILNQDGRRFTYTNSREALEQCYRDGNRVAEFDFAETSDGFLVCGHLENAAWLKGLPDSEPLTLDEFLNARVFDAFTPLDLAYLADFMRKHDNFYVVTDIQYDNVRCCGKISELYPDLRERFLIQIYHENEYQPIRDLGFPYIIFTLYRTEPNERGAEKLWTAARRDALVGFTFWDSCYQSRFFRWKTRVSGVPLFVHTVDNRERQRRDFERGVTAIYTDETDNDAFR